MTPLYPDVTVELVGQDGNAFNIMGIVSQAMRREGIPKEAITEFHSECMSGDYDHLLQTCMKWVNVT
jgi:hypothetical protein